MGKYLKLWMQANGLTRKDICEAIEIPPTTLERYLAGKPMGTKYLVQLSRLTGISCRALIENHDRDGEITGDEHKSMFGEDDE